MLHTIIGTDIAKAAELLLGGSLVAIPTETVYGLAAIATDAKAVTTIFEVKDRPFFDPLIVHCHNIEQVFQYTNGIPGWAEKLFQAFSPGPLTIVLPKKEVIPDIVTSGLDTVGIRIPSHPLALELLRMINKPLAAPSANPFGYVSPTTAQHVYDQLQGKIAYILDGGPCTIGVESTIVAEKNGVPTILRLGGISVEQIEAVLGNVAIEIHSTSNPAGPGMLESHYAPRKQVLLGYPKTFAPKTGFLAFKQYSELLPHSVQRVLSSSGDLNEAARSLFASLRELDALDLDTIYAELVPEEGLGRAINDKLRRASAK